MYLKDCKRFSVVKNLSLGSEEQMIESIRKIFKREVLLALGKSVKASVQEFCYPDRAKCKFIVEFEQEQLVPELTNSIVVDLVRMSIIRANQEWAKKQVVELRDSIAKAVWKCKKRKKENV